MRLAASDASAAVGPVNKEQYRVTSFNTVMYLELGT
jgi:hypothetical protein